MHDFFSYSLFIRLTHSHVKAHTSTVYLYIVGLSKSCDNEICFDFILSKTFCFKEVTNLIKLYFNRQEDTQIQCGHKTISIILGFIPSHSQFDRKDIFTAAVGLFIIRITYTPILSCSLFCSRFWYGNRREKKKSVRLEIAAKQKNLLVKHNLLAFGIEMRSAMLITNAISFSLYRKYYFVPNYFAILFRCVL